MLKNVFNFLPFQYLLRRRSPGVWSTHFAPQIKSIPRFSVQHGDILAHVILISIGNVDALLLDI